ncbi:hypothetical protein NQ318_020420 [Aromia moschata]|uniref:Carboxylic ester hydrolase n=1 Tax=Aromia moschata TaxID=1265417 RepID=A0AAV8YKM8_9CUCU|nr:hypothetical protein NQ318_020420 [Aromia moschata]
MEKIKFKANRIFNVDETGITTVQTKCPKVYDPKGAKKLGAAISGERGRTITGVFCVSASGNYVPPMLIYPRKRMAATLQKNRPIGTSFRCSKNGWINSELFVEWLKHFEQHVKPTDTNPILLVLDNHASHISIRAYNFCKEKHIHMVSLPPHTSDNLQPLDLTIQESGNTTDLLPVLVWIHGGVFENGDATFQTFGPKHFMDYGVIIVTMNYRVGPFGFLTTEDGVIPANIGLKDQNFALQWVQSNIQQFGGDPAKVTIFGESAGAVSVSYHLLNKNYEDLFRGAILESGTAISSFSHQRWARYYAFETAYAMSVGFTSRNSTELLLFLQSVPAEILKNVRLTIPAEKEMGIGSHRKRIWIPVIEDDSLNGTFITGPMHENILNGNIVKVPIMLGFTSEEELKFIDYDVAAESRRFDNNLELLIHNKFEMSEENKTLAGTEFRKIYTNGTFEDTYGSIVKGSTA